jgi:hypothetical protein
MSRPHITDEIVTGLSFARACILDQQAASHKRGDYSYDKRYRESLGAIALIIAAHKRSTKKSVR